MVTLHCDAQVDHNPRLGGRHARVTNKGLVCMPVTMAPYRKSISDVGQSDDRSRCGQEEERVCFPSYYRVHVAPMSILRFRSFAELEYAERGFSAEVYIAEAVLFL